MKYAVAERFVAPQGEGVFTGVVMAFVRLVGCSVGQGVCTACDTDFSRMRKDLGGGLYTPEEIVEWAGDCRHVCITGGEPLDRDLRPLVNAVESAGMRPHVETSGTKKPEWLSRSDLGVRLFSERSGRPMPSSLWVTVSPKPGYLDAMVESVASELKVIVGGLGDGPGWPTVKDALRWAALRPQTPVYLQPRNEALTIDRAALLEVVGLAVRYPRLRVSAQLHKFIGSR